MRIVSGGQTGVDRAALDAALENGVEAGGWCPADRMAEDGVIAERYPVKVLPGAGYPERTKQNVLDSDGTIVICFGEPSGGTRQTILRCTEAGKPHLLIDGEVLSPEQAALKVREFVRRHGIAVLNAAGPRASGEPRAYPYARRVFTTFLKAP